VGAVARSMACFGAGQLYLVSPQTPVRETAYFWACHGRDKLEQRITVETLEEAIAGCSLVIGTSARHGARRHRMTTPVELFEEVLPKFTGGEIALVFGNEESGLDNDHLKLCHCLTKFATDPEHSSLNLGHSVSLLLYELVGRNLTTEVGGQPPDPSQPEERQRLVQEFARFLSERGYPSHNATLDEEMTKLSNIVERAHLEAWEIRFLLGMTRHLRNFELGYVGPKGTPQSEKPL
jgi:TrmH family RNA methyltransferase